MNRVSITADEYKSILDAADGSRNWMATFATRGNEILFAKGVRGLTTGATHAHNKFHICYELLDTEPLRGDRK